MDVGFASLGFFAMHGWPLRFTDESFQCSDWLLASLSYRVLDLQTSGLLRSPLFCR
jgi:hypothetical protein